jgi:thiamine pyrophosphokinase
MRPMRAVVVAGGDVDPTDAAHLAGSDLSIGADAGATRLERLGRVPDVVVGDLDSLDDGDVERLVAAGSTIERHPVDKDASDAELAVDRAVAGGAGDVVLIGALGGLRFDHELANVLLLADPALTGVELRIVRGATTVRALHGGSRLAVEGGVGDVVSLLPIGGDAIGVTTIGLRWELDRATLMIGRSRGLSNVVVEAPASVELEDGTLLVVESRAGGAA